MKTLLALLFTFPLIIQAQDTVTVSTATELLAAIQSNRTVLINPGVYQLRDADQMKVIDENEEIHDKAITSSLFYSSGWGITLQNIENISLIGLGKTPQENRLVTSNLGDWIFTFKDCKNIVLNNLEAEHDPATKGGCSGGVWFFYTCENISIDKNRLLGSGRIGIEALEVKNLNVTNTDITECSEGILSFRSSENAIFEDCKFFNNESDYSFIDLDEAKNISFENCKISYNKSGTINEKYSKFNVFFRLFNVSELTFTNCSIKGNVARYLTTNAEGVELLKGVKLKKNKFEGKFWVKKKAKD